MIIAARKSARGSDLFLLRIICLARALGKPLFAMLERCAICLESLDTPGWGCQMLGCKHTFHKSCVAEMRRQGATSCCPLCRATSSELTTVQEMLDTAVLREMQKDYSGAARLYQEILNVDIGNVHAMVNLGVRYECGEGVEMNKAKASDARKA